MFRSISVAVFASVVSVSLYGSEGAGGKNEKIYSSLTAFTSGFTGIRGADRARIHVTKRTNGEYAGQMEFPPYSEYTLGYILTTDEAEARYYEMAYQYQADQTAEREAKEEASKK